VKTLWIVVPLAVFAVVAFLLASEVGNRVTPGDFTTIDSLRAELDESRWRGAELRWQVYEIRRKADSLSAVIYAERRAQGIEREIFGLKTRLLALEAGRAR